MRYIQSTGQLFTHDGKLLDTGWSGNGQGKNNPDMQNVHNVGPIPCGWYIIGQPYDSPHTGPFTLPLTPYSDNEMFGRGSFKMHGSMEGVDTDGFVTVDGKKQPVSEGCTIFSRAIREMVHLMATDENILDNELEVTKT